MAIRISSGVAHKIPADFKAALVADEKMMLFWESLTPLARNEWICWVTSAKQDVTRTRRIDVGLSKMRDGMRRPCCWAGCTHR
jgi:uncharacterized protein YdeI (YjbR/CyaY-like superfamily)